jgi:hypothetical protein
LALATIDSKYTDFSLFSETLIRSSNYSYRIDFFKSAGVFGYFKKNKRTFSAIINIQDFITGHFIQYVTVNNVDFFFFFIKGFFKHVKPIYRTFKFILRKKLRKLSRKAYAFKKMNRVLRYKIQKTLPHMNIRSYLHRIRVFISKSIHLVKMLNKQIPENKCLVANYTTLETFLIHKSNINKYRNYPFIFLSRN